MDDIFEDAMDDELKNKENENKTDVPADDEGAIEPRVFVVGLGQTGRELIYRLMSKVRVIGLDVEEEKLSRFKVDPEEAGVKLVSKDATSRLTWEELELAPSDTVVVVTRRDQVNLEVCRIASQDFHVKRLLGLIHSASRAAEYSAAGIETVIRAEVFASFMESRVLKDRRTAMNVGLGKGEIMEVPILPGSPVVGRPLSSFRARPWLVGAIYRQDRLIVPHGHTVIQEGDRVVIIGEPHILSGIGDFFKMGEPEFPLQYGPRIGVVATSEKSDDHHALVSESHYLAANTKATAMVMLTLPGGPEPDVDAAERICEGTDLSCEPAYLQDEEHTPWPRQLQTQDFGCLVLEDRQLGFLHRLGILRSLLLRVLEEAEYPILISKGSHPYESILVPVAIQSNPVRVAELAINLARLFDSRLDAVTITEPVFAAGEDAVEEQKGVLDRVEELCALYRLPIKIHHREGNPIREIVEQSAGYDLLVMGHRQGRRPFWPRLDLCIEIMARVSCSVMIMPFFEREE